MSDTNEVSKYRPIADFKAISHFIAANPGLVIFAFYLTVATIGFIYLIAFYDHFGLNVVTYLELSDILIAGIKDPIVLLATFGAVVVTLLAWLWAYVQAPFNAKLVKKFSTGPLRIIPHILGVSSARSFWWHALLIFTAYSYFFIALHSERKAESIINDKKNLVLVKSDAIGDNTNPYSLLGTSINFVFLYNHQQNNTLILPLESIQSIQPLKKQQEPTTNNKSTPKKAPSTPAAKH